MSRYLRRRIILFLACLILSFWMGAMYGQSRVPEPKHIYVPVLIEKEEEIKMDTEWKVFTATAYCSCSKCCGKSDGITKSGEEAVEGLTIAADWNVLPKGSLVEIDGIGYRVVQDTGVAIQGNKIDIYFEKHEDALSFGKQEVKLRIVRQI